MTCHICESPITGTLDTFGDFRRPLCLHCWTQVERRPVALLRDSVPEPNDPGGCGDADEAERAELARWEEALPRLFEAEKAAAKVADLEREADMLRAKAEPPVIRVG